MRPLCCCRAAPLIDSHTQRWSDSLSKAPADAWAMIAIRGSAAAFSDSGSDMSTCAFSVSLSALESKSHRVGGDSASAIVSDADSA